MNDQNNVTSQAIAITTSDGVANVHPEVLRQYTREAFGHFDAMNTAKEELKQMIEAAAEGTKLPKKLIRKYLKAKYDAKVKETTELGNLFSALDEALEA